MKFIKKFKDEFTRSDSKRKIKKLKKLKKLQPIKRINKKYYSQYLNEEE